jgi:hypothetical protein
LSPQSTITKEISVPELDQISDLQQPARRHQLWRLRLHIGKMINSYLVPVEELDLIEKRAYVKRARSPGSRLTESEISALKTWMLNVQDRELRRTYFHTTNIENTFQGLLIPLIDGILERDETVKKVVNVGSNYAYVDGLLARKYPDVRFVGVDFAANLVEYNQEFAAQNLEFRSGYALDFLESGHLAPDVLMFSSCAYEIKNAEIRRYCAAIPIGAYVVFNEPLYNLPGGGIVDPLDVSPAESIAVYSHVGASPGEYGPLGITHNYKKIIEEENFEVLHYRAFRPSFTDLRMVNVIGRKIKADSPGHR